MDSEECIERENGYFFLFVPLWCLIQESATASEEGDAQEYGQEEYLSRHRIVIKYL